MVVVGLSCNCPVNNHFFSELLEGISAVYGVLFLSSLIRRKPIATLFFEDILCDN